MNNIADYRRRKEWTQRTLAQVSGVSEWTIINYETDKRAPRLDLLERIAKALDCQVADLIKGKEGE